MYKLPKNRCWLYRHGEYAYIGKGMSKTKFINAVSYVLRKYCIGTTWIKERTSISGNDKQVILSHLYKGSVLVLNEGIIVQRIYT